MFGWSRSRDAESARRLDWIRWRCANDRRVCLVHVASVYQFARHGTKAVVVHDETGYNQDAWFHEMMVHSGQVLVVMRGSRWGPHNSNPSVLYVDYVFDPLPASVVGRAVRHQLRQARQRKVGNLATVRPE